MTNFVNNSTSALLCNLNYLPKSLRMLACLLTGMTQTQHTTIELSKQGVGLRWLSLSFFLDFSLPSNFFYSIPCTAFQTHLVFEKLFWLYFNQLCHTQNELHSLAHLILCICYNRKPKKKTQTHLHSNQFD